MKFFTYNWAYGGMEDTEADAVRDLYQDHLAAIVPRLPEPLRQLATVINVHDGRIRRVYLDRSSETFVLALRCGDLQTGYFDLDLTYLGANIAPGDIESLRALAIAVKAEVLYDEVDIADEDVFLHRLLLWPDSEIEIAFRELTIEIVRWPDREFIREGFNE